MAEIKDVLVTGATGFLGRRLASALVGNADIELSVMVRAGHRFRPDGALVNEQVYEQVYELDLAEPGDYGQALENRQVVIHAAARAHIRDREKQHSLAEYRKVNTEGTLNLARQAAAAGVNRFIFISTIGVNGETSTRPFRFDDPPNPTGGYALSKWEAEQGLWEIARDSGMEVVVIRPPLIYGPGAPGNFGSLVRWVDRGVPLPLGLVHNRRSLIALDNLIDLILICIDHPRAANQLLLAGDGEDLSTTELLRAVARAMGRPSRLIPLPVALLRLGATVSGKGDVARKLLGSLQVDIGRTRELLGWTPLLSVDEGLKRCFAPESAG